MGNMSPTNVAIQALRATQNTGLPLNAPLVDKSPLGSFWVRVGVTIGTGDTAIAIQLPRVPSCYIIVRSSNGAGVYDGTTSSWSSSNIVLRATTSTVVSLLVG
jgi:hypothetical protein